MSTHWRLLCYVPVLLLADWYLVSWQGFLLHCGVVLGLRCIVLVRLSWGLCLWMRRGALACSSCNLVC